MYRKIEAILRDQIFSGELTAGDKVPTEQELGRVFKVSRPTVRQALQILEQEKLIVRSAGRGTFVNEIAAELPVRRRAISLDELADLKLSGTRIVLGRKGVLAARGDVQSALQLPFGEEVFYFIRVHRLDGLPLAGAKVYLPYRHGGALLDKRDMLAQDFFAVLSRRLNARIASISYRVEALLADARTGELFATPVGSPLISVRRISYDPHRQPLEHSHILLRSDYCQITFDLTRGSSSGRWRRSESG